MAWEAINYIDRFEKLKEGRSNWNAPLQEIADYCYPRQAVFENDGYMVPAEDRMSKVFDSTAIHAVEMLAGGLHGMMTDLSNEWFTLTLNDNEYEGDKDIETWLDEVTKILYTMISDPFSGFSVAHHELYMEFSAFGTGCLYVSEDVKKKIVRFNAIPLAQCYVDENKDGHVDTVYRRFYRTVRQLVEQFGRSKVSLEVGKKYDKKEYDTKIEVIHAVQPNEKKATRKGAKGWFPWVSCYLEVSNKHKLSESGFYEMPYMVPRFFRAPGEVYGRSPGWTALPDIKMLNTMQETIIKSAQKVVSPPLMAPDDGFFSPIRTMPNSINYYRAGTADRIEPMPSGGNIPIGLEMTNELRIRISKMFYLDQLEFGQSPQMTATEVMQRTEDRLRLLNPVNGRLQQELLGPEIDRLFNIAGRFGLIPPPPEAIQGKPIKIEYTSPIAMAQKQLKAQGLMKLMQVSAPVIDHDPQAFDKIDSDKWLEYVGRLYSVNPKIFRSNETVSEIRQQRGQAQEREQQSNEQLSNASALKNVAGAMEGLSNATGQQ